MGLDSVRIYIHPSVFSSKLNRRLLKLIASRVGGVLGFERERVSLSRDAFKGTFYIEAPKGREKDLRKLLKRFKIPYTRDGKGAIGYFESRILADSLARLEVGIPIGVNRRGDRLVLLEEPILGISRDRVVPLYLSQVYRSVLWIGVEFEGYEEFFELIDVFGTSNIPSGYRFELAKLLAESTIGKRHIVELADKMSSSEDLMGDEEFVLSTDAEKLLSQVKEWGIIDFERMHELGKHLFDVSSLPSVAYSIAALLGIFLGYDLIIVDSTKFDNVILNYLGGGQSFLVIDKFSSPNWARMIIDSENGTVLKKMELDGRTIYYSEGFRPLWDFLEGEFS